MSAQGQGHDLRVQEAQTNHTANVTIGVQPQGRHVAGPGGIVAGLAGLVEQRWLWSRTTQDKWMLHVDREREEHDHKVNSLGCLGLTLVRDASPQRWKWQLLSQPRRNSCLCSASSWFRQSHFHSPRHFLSPGRWLGCRTASPGHSTRQPAQKHLEHLHSK